MFALPVHVRRENAGKRENRQIQNHHNTVNKCTKHILGSHKPRCRSQSYRNEKIKPPQNTKTHFRFTYVKRMLGSENRQIQNYHNTRNKLHKAKFSGVKKTRCNSKVSVMRRSNPGEQNKNKKRTSGNCGEATKSTDTEL